jgi:phenylalanyl-tRNA synthetase beta subunit
VAEALAPEKVLLRIEPFDRYEDPERGLSYGIRLYLQAPDRTLEETDIHRLLAKAILALERLGAQVRKAEKF